MFIGSSNALNVEVVSFILEDNPSSITINLKVCDKSFFSKITYHSIPCWQDIWNKCRNESTREFLLGALVAWDSMRFLALGGEELTLCEGLALDENMQQLWHYCFLNQFGEWRYRNNFQYRSSLLPRVMVKSNRHTLSRQDAIANLRTPRNERHLITNGGGKDTLVGMLLINDLNIDYDVYEGYLPIGGSWELQKSLLEKVRTSVAPKQAEVISVTVTDNFFSGDDTEIQKIGVLVKHYKTDFAVGHTANYPGYYPIILFHDYTHVWFNIEASADRTMVNWNNEAINHQWCKTEEYKEKSTLLYQRLVGNNSFKGFFSTIGGLYDTHIYSIAVKNEELIQKTHSCNYGKPWCLRCPKCCFSYLMLASFKGEAFAMKVVGSDQSLFDIGENAKHFEDLLDPSRVAWECVPSHEECLLAIVECSNKNINNSIIHKYVEDAKSKVKYLEQKYLSINWDKVPHRLRDITLQRILDSGCGCTNAAESKTV